MTSHHRPLARRLARLGPALALVALLAGGVLAARPAAAAGIVVTSAADGAPADDGACTLREAILNANRDSSAGSSDCAAGSGPDTISFDASLAGQTILLSTAGDTTAGPSALAITSTLSIEGLSGAGITIARDGAAANLRLFYVASSGALTLSNLTLANGRAAGDSPAPHGNDGGDGLGGAIYSAGGAVTLVGCTLTGNAAAGGNGNGSGSGGSGLGGAIYANGGALRITNSTFASNSAAPGAGGPGGSGAAGTARGGGVYGRDGSITVISSTLSDNSASLGGAIFSLTNSITATLALTNTIAANSPSGTDLEVQTSGALTPSTLGSHNLVESQSGFAGGIISSADPKLGPLAANGGPTSTFALQAGSPAIDAGTGTGAPVSDQRGQPRGTVDIGAYEAHPWVAAIAGQATDEDTPLVASFGVGDTALASAGYTVSAASSNSALIPAAGLQIGGAGATRTLTITPGLNLSGSATITVTVSDSGQSMQSSFALAVRPVDDPPVAVADAYATSEDTTLAITGTGVLANDADVDSVALTALLDSTTSHGSLALSSSGAFSYTPAANYCGPDSFGYHASDGALASSTVTATITVACVNDAPIASSGALTTTEDMPASGALSASDQEGDALTYSIVGAPAKGTIQGLVASTGAFTYTPSADANGSDSFTFRVSDGVASSNVATVTVSIAAVNDPPRFTAGADQSVAEDAGPQSVPGWAQGISAGAPDEAGQTLTFQITSNSNPALFSAGPTISAGGTLSYTPAANASGSATIAVRLTDSGGTANSGSDQSATQSFTIAVSPVNDPPVNSVPSAQSTAEDTALVFSSAAGNPISVADVDAGTGALSMTLAATNGTLTLASSAGLTFSSGDGTSDTSMSFSGTSANINAALSGLTFAPAADYSGPASITVTTNDLGNTGSGGAQSNADTIAITINPVNDPPVNTVPGGQSTSEDTALVFSSTAGNSIGVADVDAGGNPVRITLSASHGALTLASTSGLTFSSGDGTADSNMTFSGSLPNINAALNGLTYTPAADYTGSDTLNITTSDLGNTGSGGALSDADTVAVAVGAVNDPPVNHLPSAQTTAEDTALVFSSAAGNLISISDIDAGGSNVYVTLIATNGTLTLGGTAGLTFIFGDGSADAIMSFTAPVAAVDAALSGMVYTPAPNYSGPAGVTIGTNDLGNTGSGGALSDTDTAAIAVSPVNDPPVNTVPGTQSTPEDTALVFSSAAGNLLAVADVDAGSSPVRITLGAPDGTLTLAGTSGLTFSVGDGASDGDMTFTGALADVNAALSGLTYTPAPNFNGPTSITLASDDQGNTGSGGARSDSDTVTINVGAVNDPPTVSTVADQVTGEDIATSAIGFRISDVETLADSLTVAASSSNTALLPNANITLGGSRASRTITLAPAANQSGMSTITISVGDGTNTTTTSFVLTVSPINDPPTLSPIADLTIGEDAGPQIISLAGISAGPADEAGQTLGVTATSDNPGLIPDPAVTYVAGSAVGTLNFAPVANANGTATISVRVRDSGGTANGASDTVLRSFVISVSPVNDAPTLNAIADVVLAESAPPQLVALSGIAAGPANEQGQHLSVTATSDNPALIASLAISYVDGAPSGSLQITLVPNTLGAATVSVRVADDGGTSGGGVNTITRTFAVTVGAVNHRPTIDQPPNLTLLEDAGAQVVGLSGIGPGAASESGQTLTITASSDNPALIASPTVSYVAGATVATLNIAPKPNANGVAAITVRVQDSGGTANGGLDLLERVLIVTVTPVNDAPDFALGASLTVAAAAGPQTVTGWARGFSPGPPNEASQTAIGYSVLSVSDPSLFAVQPTLDASGTLRYTPMPGAAGSATIGVAARDSGGTANGGADTSATRSFTITVKPSIQLFMPLLRR
jgi:CSLREA domain-containing protein